LQIDWQWLSTVNKQIWAIRLSSGALQDFSLISTPFYALHIERPQFSFQNL